MRKENPTEYEMLRDLWRTHYIPRDPHAIREWWKWEMDKVRKHNSDYSWKAWKKALIRFGWFPAVGILYFILR